MKKSIAKISFLFSAALLVAACGGGGGDAPTPAPPTTGTPAPAAPTPILAQGACAQAYVSNILTFVVPRGQSCSTEVPGLNPGSLNTFTCTTQGVISQTSGPTAGTGVLTFTEASVQCASAYIGAYAGSFAGADSGSFSVNVNDFGIVSGNLTSRNSNNAQFPVAGQVSNGGAFSATATAGTAGAAVYTGTINVAGAVTGTWQYQSPRSGSGTFAGQRAAAQ
jgi:hypothetical protein